MTPSSPSPHHRDTGAHRCGSWSNSRTATAPSRWRQRRLHVLDPTKYLLAYDPAVDDEDLLIAACHLLRTQAWLTSLHNHTGHAVDLPSLRGSLADLTTALDGFDVLTRHHNAARRSIDQADQGLAAPRADLRNRSDILHELLHLTTTDTAA